MPSVENSACKVQQDRWLSPPQGPCAKELMDIARKVRTVLARASDSIRFIGANSFNVLRAVGAPVLLGALGRRQVSGGDHTFFR
jgi:hypothetical protein